MPRRRNTRPQNNKIRNLQSKPNLLFLGTCFYRHIGTSPINDTAVHRDLVYLRQKAQENLQKHIHEVVPEEYQKCMVGMKRNLKETLAIAETVSDPKIKLQVRAIAVDCYKYIMEMTTGGVIVTDTIKYVQGQMEHLNAAEKKLLQDIKDKKEDKEKRKISSSRKLTIQYFEAPYLKL